MEWAASITTKGTKRLSSVILHTLVIPWVATTLHPKWRPRSKLSMTLWSRWFSVRPTTSFSSSFEANNLSLNHNSLILIKNKFSNRKESSSNSGRNKWSQIVTESTPLVLLLPVFTSFFFLRSILVFTSSFPNFFSFIFI